MGRIDKDLHEETEADGRNRLPIGKVEDLTHDLEEKVPD
jgi:hypothetical protein